VRHKKDDERLSLLMNVDVSSKESSSDGSGRRRVRPQDLPSQYQNFSLSQLKVYIIASFKYSSFSFTLSFLSFLFSSFHQMSFAFIFVPFDHENSK